LRPAWPDAHVVAGTALSATGKHAEAAEAFARAAVLEPLDAHIHYNHGNALSAAGRVEQALHAYREALRLAPGFAAAHTNMANLLLNLGQLREAERHYREALQSDATLAEPWHGLGVTLARSGRGAEAASSFREAAELRPLWAAPRLAESWLRATDPDPGVRDGPRALELAEHAVASAGPDARGLDTLGAALAECGLYDEAARIAAQAAALADRGGEPSLAAHIRERQRSYLASKPHRDRKGAGGFPRP